MLIATDYWTHEPELAVVITITSVQSPVSRGDSMVQNSGKSK